MNFRIGCAVWSYKNWVGNLYPSYAREGDFLKLYSQRFLTVEGNTTFYAVPEEKTVRRWEEQTSDNFRFCLKLPRDITHQGLLVPQIDRALDFMARVENLGDKLGCIFVQLPPNYSPMYLEDLGNFLEGLSQDKIRLAVEVRHLDWFVDRERECLNNILDKLNIARVVLDTRPIYNCADDPQVAVKRKKPKVPLIEDITTDFTLVRFISHPIKEYNRIYLEEWTEKIDLWLAQKKDIYFFVHCPIEDYSPQMAQDFQRLLEAKKVPVPPLPWDILEFVPQQLKLF
jgi:uncharacterized protein YecE (DUF72 family)